MDRFIVGTGRCGSTLLSRMLGHNRKLLSLFEFWSVLDREAVFAEGVFSGPEVVALAQRPNLLNDLVITRSPHLDAAATGHSIRKEARGYALTAHRRPAIEIFLAGLSDEHEALIADTLAFLGRQPAQPLADHWRELFGFLTRRLGREAWVERSGVSIDHFVRLRAWYPDAKFVHLHRDGPTNALGIRAFRHFVLYASFFFDPPSDDEVAAAFTCDIGGKDDPILRRMSSEMPSLEDFGRYWSWQIVRGVREFLQLPPERRMMIAYEEMIADTPGTLARLADFLELPEDGDWIARASAEVDPEAIPDRVADLEAAEVARLRAACRPGMVALGRDDTHPFEAAMASLRRVYAALEPAQLNA